MGYTIKIDVLRQHEMNETKDKFTFSPQERYSARYVSLLKIHLNIIFDVTLRSVKYVSAFENFFLKKI